MGHGQACRPWVVACTASYDAENNSGDRKWSQTYSYDCLHHLAVSLPTPGCRPAGPLLLLSL